MIPKIPLWNLQNGVKTGVFAGKLRSIMACFNYDLFFFYGYRLSDLVDRSIISQYGRTFFAVSKSTDVFQNLEIMEVKFTPQNSLFGTV